LTDDAPGDLLAAVAAALGPRGEGSCSWHEEPGEYAWLFRRVGEELLVRVEWYDEWRELLSDQKCTVVFERRVPARDAAEAIATAAERLLNEHGGDGYLAQWGADPFPTRRLDRLRSAIAERFGPR
jgi:hypothetical protein